MTGQDDRAAGRRLPDVDRVGGADDPPDDVDPGDQQVPDDAAPDPSQPETNPYYGIHDDDDAS